MAAFVDLTGDDNPVHLDDAYAARLGLGGRVVHGLLTAAFVSTVIGTLLPGRGALWLSQRFNFRVPVRVGDSLRVEVTIRQVSPATRVLVLGVIVTNQRARTVLDGDAHVQVLGDEGAVAPESAPALVAGGSQFAPFHRDPVDDAAPRTGAVVVTGSGRGIGAAIAVRLAADGFRVVVNYRTDEARARMTLESILAAGGEASMCRADVSDAEQATALMAHAVGRFGRVDALVNNAGGEPDRRPLVDTPWADLERQLAGHLGAAFLCVQAVLPGMLQRRSGRIVNITSQSAYGQPPARMAGYVVAKAALAAFTRCLAVEAGPHGVTANAVAPGMADTEMIADVSPRTRMTLAAQAPLRRLATAGDVADVVAFLLGPGGAYVTGQTIQLSGGQVMT